LRGSTVFQVQSVYQTVNEIGTSKHQSKEDARSSGAKTWHEIGKKIGIKSYSTADAYRDVWRSALDFTKDNFGIKDIEMLSGTHLKAFLVSKIDDGVAHATLSQYTAACEKLEVALNRYALENRTGKQYDFSPDIKEARLLGKHLERFEGSRAYSDPDGLVQVVEGELFRLAASIQREGGARISEANHITKESLRGLRHDKITGQLKGWIHVEGKGGKERDVGVSPETYNRVVKIVENARFEFDKDSYRNELKSSAKKTNQDYEGSHGLRWSWAQDRHQELQQHGMTYEQTLSQISQEMGHERGDITEHYLK